MQSADMSFDLLNDKVSFLGHGQDSFWGGGDDTLDFSEICVPSAMKAKLDQLVPIASPVEVMPKRYEPVFSPPTKTIAAPLVMSPTTETAMKVPLPTSPTFSAPPSRNSESRSCCSQYVFTHRESSHASSFDPACIGRTPVSPNISGRSR